MIIGLTGYRHSGKTEAANILTKHGFIKAHAFAPGKAMAIEYFRYCGATTYEAQEMTNGVMRDLPSPYLPDRQTPRHFMEKLGRFMGTTLGAEWTLGQEIRRARGSGAKHVVFESVVYEAEELVRHGGFLLRVIRPEARGDMTKETDRFVRGMNWADCTNIDNDGDLHHLEAQLLAAIEGLRKTHGAQA